MNIGERLTLPRGALAHVRAADPRMAALIDRVGRHELRVSRGAPHLASLLRSIVYQQLSGKAAATIHGRFLALFGGAPPTPARVLATPIETLRGAGLSMGKTLSVRDLCQRIVDGSLQLDSLDALDDQAVIDTLVKVRGIGVWSAQMFLIFHLGRLDVWPTGDLGVQKGAALVFRTRALPSPSQLERLGAPFAPYRTLIAHYLWRSLDQLPLTSHDA